MIITGFLFSTVPVQSWVQFRPDDKKLNMVAMTCLVLLQGVGQTRIYVSRKCRKIEERERERDRERGERERREYGVLRSKRRKP